MMQIYGSKCGIVKHFEKNFQKGNFEQTQIIEYQPISNENNL
jgi:hypothetical protein